MKRDKRIEELIAQVQYRSDASILARIRGRMDNQWPVCASRTRERNIATWWYKPAFAVLMLLVLAGLIGLFSRSGRPAYALEQTIEAVKDIRYFHFRLRTPRNDPEREAWIEYDPNHASPRVRVNFYGLRTTMVWDQGVTQYWWWDKKELCLYQDDEYTEKILHFVQRYDPRQAVSYLQEQARQRNIQVEIHEPGNGAEPIVVTVTYDPNTFLVNSPKMPMREQCHIDPVTKLITRVEIEGLVKERYVLAGTWEYVDYNRPFEPGTFDLLREIPADVNVSDTTGIPMGIERGSLSDDEIAVEVVREFLEAWAAKDYDRATQIYGYISAEHMTSIHDTLLEKWTVLRVISVGPPVSPEPPLRGLRVPCKVEYEGNGRTRIGRLEFRASERSPGRWCLRCSHQQAKPTEGIHMEGTDTDSN